MKILIKDSQSGRFLARRGTWTNDAHDARDFGSIAATRAMFHGEKVSRLLVVLYFENLDYTVNVRKEFYRCNWNRFASIS